MTDVDEGLYEADTSQLFDPTPLTVTPPKESTGVRLTKRRKAAIDAGINPVTRRPLTGPDGETCRTCAFLRLQGGTSGRYFKCIHNATGGPATDIRVGWPACALWAEIEEVGR